MNSITIPTIKMIDLKCGCMPPALTSSDEKEAITNDGD